MCTGLSLLHSGLLLIPPIFAFCRSYQPSPFFVLDEIDAALDNTNINRVRVLFMRNEKRYNYVLLCILTVAS